MYFCLCYCQLVSDKKTQVEKEEINVHQALWLLGTLMAT